MQRVASSTSDSMAKKLNKKTKAFGQRAHAMMRIKERYNLDITEDQYHRLCNYIKKGQTQYDDGTSAQFLIKQSGRVTIWELDTPLCDKKFIAVYDKERKTIASFLPPGLSVEEIEFKGAEIEEEFWNSDCT